MPITKNTCFGINENKWNPVPEANYNFKTKFTIA